MPEAYIYYSSMTLFVMGITAFFISILFRRRSKTLNSLPRDLSVTVFSHTFVVFDPYAIQKKVIHRFLGLLPFVGIVTALAAVMAVWSMLTNGLLITVFIAIIGLNIIVIEEAPEVYTTARTFIKAAQKKSDFAKGDLRVLKVVQRLAPKMCNYYLGMAILFITASIALPYAWEALPNLATLFGDSVARVSGLNGMLIIQVVAILFLLNMAVLQLVASKLKSRIFRYEIK